MSLIDNYLLDNYAIDGPDGKIKYASGTFTTAATLESFPTVGGSSSRPFVLVNFSDIDFVPDVVMIKTAASTTFINETIVDTKAPKQNGETLFGAAGSTYYRLISPAYINESGFKLPVLSANAAYSWQAFKTQ